jgi:succinoglycan biosynthesis protein ExoV
MMKLIYHKSATGNFGDDLNPWLWPQLLPGIFDTNDEILFVGIGTILGLRVRNMTSAYKVVFGSGVGIGTLPTIDDRWKFYCVRGPLTQKALSLDPHLAISDPAILVRILNLPQEQKCYKVSFMPHHASTELTNWANVCHLLGIKYIDPTDNVDETLRNIQRSELLISEAMHGAIVADALRIPWIPASLHYGFNEFKWQDWCESLGISLNLQTFPVRLNQKALKGWHQFLKRKIKLAYITAGLQKLKHVEPTLSSDSAIDLATTRLQEKLEKFKCDYL